MNNLNDGMVWGILPLLLAGKAFSIEQIGLIVALYPAVWGLGQMVTGKMADHFSIKAMLFLGMFLQGIVLILFAFTDNYLVFIGLSILLGVGTAVVYPTFLAAIAGFTHPKQRAESIGIFRLWRDLGYAIGALLTGIIADMIGISFSILVIGALTIMSSMVNAESTQKDTS